MIYHLENYSATFQLTDFKFEWCFHEFIKPVVSSIEAKNVDAFQGNSRGQLILRFC